MSEVVSIIDWIKEFGFSIAVAVYLLWERTTTFKESQKRWEEMNRQIMEVIQANTAAMVEMKATIEKLCTIVNGGAK